MHAKLLQLCPTLCNPMTVAHQASLSMEILQARTLEWVATPSSRGSSQPRDWIQVSCTAGEPFTIWAMMNLQNFPLSEGRLDQKDLGLFLFQNLILFFKSQNPIINIPAQMLPYLWNLPNCPSLYTPSAPLAFISLSHDCINFHLFIKT